MNPVALFAIAFTLGTLCGIWLCAILAPPAPPPRGDKPHWIGEAEHEATMAELATTRAQLVETASQGAMVRDEMHEMARQVRINITTRLFAIRRHVAVLESFTDRYQQAPHLSDILAKCSYIETQVAVLQGLEKPKVSAQLTLPPVA